MLERGTHDELLAMPGGAYRGMWQRQLTEPATTVVAGTVLPPAASGEGTDGVSG